jgi:hypothetical protein
MNVSESSGYKGTWILSLRSYGVWYYVISYVERPANILVELAHSLFREYSNLLYPEGESNKFLQNVGPYVLKFTASYTRRH